MPKLHSIAVYCGSNFGIHSLYRQHATECATVIANAGLELIYGGAKVGLMGTIADTVLNLGGKVTGVMPQSLVDYEVSHSSLTNLHIVNSMHERKALIADLADGFIMLPGGPGSWEEFFEIMTWAKLAYHQKPFGILNTGGYYDLLIQFVNHAVKEEFLHQDHCDMVIIEECPSLLLEKMHNYQAPNTSAWIDKSLPTTVT